MQQALKKAMTVSISDVLETMFFMTIDINENSMPEAFAGESAEKLFISTIDFHGQLSGSFFLIIPESILRSMTETFMGMESCDVTESHLNGTVQETINMIAGNTFSTLDKTAVYDLGIPKLVEFDSVINRCPADAPKMYFLQVETFAGKIGLKVCFAFE